jgi:hypothetical protein
MVEKLHLGTFSIHIHPLPLEQTLLKCVLIEGFYLLKQTHDYLK